MRGWEIVPFGEVCEISGGSQPPKDNFIYEPKEGYIRLIQVRDYRTDNYITYIPKEKAKKFCSADDIMIGRYGPPIFGIFSGIEGAYNVALMKAIPNEEKLDKEYFRWFLKTHDLVRFVEKTSKRAAGQDGVRKERLYQYPVPIPPLSEQKQIVAILDEAFSVIERSRNNIEKNIENAKELFQSKLNEIFSQKGDGWEEKSFQELSSRIGDGLHGTPEYDNDGDFFFINGNNLNDGAIEIKSSTKRVNKEEYDKHKRDLTSNTVLISINGTLGKVAFYNDEPVILGKSACYINFNKEVNKYFIKYLVRSSLFFKNMASQSTGATIKNFSLKSMRNYKLYLPPPNEQNILVNQLKEFDGEILRLESNYLQELVNLEELKKSILQKAFSGELTKKDIVYNV